jgi:hypothetical protein
LGGSGLLDRAERVDGALEWGGARGEAGCHDERADKERVTVRGGSYGQGSTSSAHIIDVKSKAHMADITTTGTTAQQSTVHAAHQVNQVTKAHKADVTMAARPPHHSA